MLNEELFANKIAELSEIMPGLKINEKIMYKYLKDISDDNFLYAIDKIVSTEMYSNVNIIALIKNKIKNRSNLIRLN